MPMVFDLETAPLPNALELAEPFTPPSNYKTKEAIEGARKRYEDKVLKDAALHAKSGKILALACMDDPSSPYVAFGDEPQLLETFWTLLSETNHDLIGFNIKQFDLPFAVQRSWVNKITVPRWVRSMGSFENGGWDQRFIDLMLAYNLGDRHGYVGLGTLAKLFGIGSKSKDGEYFFLMDRAEATEYCINDLRLTWKIAERMGYIAPSDEPSPF